MKQNQAIAITNGKKSRAEKVLTDAYKAIQKPEIFTGVDRVYRPIDDEGIGRPAEKKQVQFSVKEAIKAVSGPMADMINFVATMDVGNCAAKANIVVEGNIIAERVPATHLIFLEKKLEDLKTFVSKLPILDVAEDWTWNSNSGCYASEPRTTSSTAKALKSKVLYEATKEHPAQVEAYTIDEIVGYWTTISLSGAMPYDEKQALIDKIIKVSDAVKVAREEANSIEVNVQETGDSIITYIFGE